MGVTLTTFQREATHRDRLAAESTRAGDPAVKAAIERGTRSRNRFILSVGVATGAALCLLVVGTVALRRWVVVPINQLHTDIDAVGDGDLQHTITPPTGPRDLVELAAAADRMRTRILRQRDAVERAGEAVDQDAPAVAALRELLAPVTATVPPGLDVAATLLPAEGVLAGDWYDLLAVDGRLFISIGDVCGHGASTGIAAVRTKFALLDAMHLGLEPSEALRLAAQRFGESSEFVTCTVVELDSTEGAGHYANAGHPSPLIVSPRGEVRALEPTGPLIGPFPAEWHTSRFALSPGETLVMYSDGFVEARDASGHELGADAIALAVTTTATAPARATMEELISALFRHSPDGLVDDVTVVVARRP
jgi:sigma-B regulation protein RsbU (phosphoserine phosphatase)